MLAKKKVAAKKAVKKVAKKVVPMVKKHVKEDIKEVKGLVREDKSLLKHLGPKMKAHVKKAK